MVSFFERLGVSSTNARGTLATALVTLGLAACFPSPRTAPNPVCGGQPMACTRASGTLACRNLARVDTVATHEYLAFATSGVAAGDALVPVTRTSDGVVRNVLRSGDPMTSSYRIDRQALLDAFSRTGYPESFSIPWRSPEGDRCATEVQFAFPSVQCESIERCARHQRFPRGLCQTYPTSLPVPMNDVFELRFSTSGGTEPAGTTLPMAVRQLPAGSFRPQSLTREIGYWSYDRASLDALAFQNPYRAELLPGREATQAYGFVPRCRVVVSAEDGCIAERCSAAGSCVPERTDIGYIEVTDLDDSIQLGVSNSLEPGAEVAIDVERFVDGQRATLRSRALMLGSARAVRIPVRAMIEAFPPSLADSSFVLRDTSTLPACSTRVRVDRAGLQCSTVFACRASTCDEHPVGPGIVLTHTGELRFRMSSGAILHPTIMVPIRQLSTGRVARVTARVRRDIELGSLAVIHSDDLSTAFGVQPADVGVVRLEFWPATPTSPECALTVAIPGLDGDAGLPPPDVMVDVADASVDARVDAAPDADAAADAPTMTMAPPVCAWRVNLCSRSSCNPDPGTLSLEPTDMTARIEVPEEYPIDSLAGTRTVTRLEDGAWRPVNLARMPGTRNLVVDFEAMIQQFPTTPLGETYRFEFAVPGCRLDFRVQRPRLRCDVRRYCDPGGTMCRALPSDPEVSLPTTGTLRYAFEGSGRLLAPGFLVTARQLRSGRTRELIATPEAGPGGLELVIALREFWDFDGAEPTGLYRMEWLDGANVAAACRHSVRFSEPDAGAPGDASTDAATDVVVDSSMDAAVDSGIDASTDTGADTGIDTGVDAESVACPSANPTAGTTTMLGTGSGSYLARRLAVGSGYVAWADGTSLRLAPSNGSAPAIVVDTGQVTAIAMSGADLYWVQATASDRAQLKRRPLAAPATEVPTNIALSLRIVNQLVVTSDWIFALDDYNSLLIAAPRGREHLSFPLSNVGAGGSFRNMAIAREGTTDRIVFDRYTSFGSPCYRVLSVPVPPVGMQPTYTARVDYEPPSGTTCTAASFFGLAADARGVVVHDPSGLPSLRALWPAERIGAGRGDGTSVGLWRDCVVSFVGPGYAATERGGAHRSRLLPGTASGALFAIAEDAVFVVVGGTSGSAFSVARIDL